MASYNRVILVGNTTRDPEVRYTPSGLAVCDIGLAVNDRRKDNSGQWIEETTFVDVTLWGSTAGVAAQYLTKGAPVLIEGRLKLDTWEQDGQKRSKLRVVGERLVLLGKSSGETPNAPQRATRAEKPASRAPQSQNPNAEAYNGDIPF